MFTADQQLFKVAIEVQWVHPDLFPNLIPRLGGIHMLMSFVGVIGTLMAQILESVAIWWCRNNANRENVSNEHESYMHGG